MHVFHCLDGKSLRMTGPQYATYVGNVAMPKPGRLETTVIYARTRAGRKAKPGGYRLRMEWGASFRFEEYDAWLYWIIRALFQFSKEPIPEVAMKSLSPWRQKL